MSAETTWRVMDKGWESMQIKSFTGWCNLHLKKVASNVDNLEKDFTDGLKLALLLTAISGETIPRISKKVGMRIQMLQNLKCCMDFIAAKGIRLENISAEDICDGNLKLILGLVWTLIEKFEINDIDEGELNAKDALLFWCQKQVKPYNGDGVQVQNFHKSWKSGLAFCAIIHKHKPGLIPWADLDKTEAGSAANLALAFKVAEEACGIPPLLGVDDMVHSEKPDERSVMTYVSQYYKYFAASAETDTATRRVGNLVKAMRDADNNKSNYERDARELVDWIDAKKAEIDGLLNDNTLAAAEAQAEWFQTFVRDEKPPKATVKLNLEALINSIQLKLSSGNKPPYVPPTGLSTAEIQEKWDSLENQERESQAKALQELARQRKLRDLVTEFNRKASKLEAWHGEKAAYCAVEEEISTLTTAQTKVKLHEAFNRELSGSTVRVQAVRELAKQIVDLDYKEKDEVAARAAKIDECWESLAAAGKAKEAALADALAREEMKENLRRKFAEAAKDTNDAFKKTAIDVGRYKFGTNLQAVQDYKTSTLDPSSASINAESDAALAAVQAVADELTAAGITDNKYTVLTMDDMAKGRSNVNDALAKREAAYAAELERQQAMEAKRIEFAQAAAGFVALVDETSASVDSQTGEPEELTAAIKAVYKEGAELQEMLDAVTSLDVECQNMGIVSNPHTDLTVAKLRAKSKHLAIHVKNYLYALEQERVLKSDYALKTDAFVAWATENIASLPTIEFPEATLQEARVAKTFFLNWRVGEKATNAALKNEIVSLAGSITSTLAAGHNRPPFAPQPGRSVDDITSLWTDLLAAEKVRDEKITQQVAKQEKIVELVRTANAALAEMKEFTTTNTAYLSKEEEISTLTAAQVQVTTFEAYVQEYEAFGVKRAGLLSTVAELESLAYPEIANLQASVNEAVSEYDGLTGSASIKEATLKAKLAEEQAKEDARMAFAKAAAGYLRWNHDAKDTVADYDFGFDLEAVTSYVETLNANDEAQTTKDASLKADVAAKAQALIDLGVTSNTHSSVTTDDIERESANLATELRNRRAAYEAELARQQAMEERRVTFAGVAATFVTYLADQTKALEATEGSEEERIAAIKEAWQDGAAAAAELENVKTANDACVEMGITENKHTEYTYVDLTTALAVFNAAQSNLIAALAEKKEMKERTLAQEAAWADRDALERLSIKYSQTAQSLNSWIDHCDENMIENVAEMTVPAAVAEQADLYESIQAGRDYHVNLMGEFVKLGEELGAKGGSMSVSVADVQSKMNATLAAMDERKTHIEAATERAKKCEDARVAFFNAVTAFASWLAGQKADVNKEVSGELDVKLANMKDRLLVEHNGTGAGCVATVKAAWTALEELDVTAADRTEETDKTVATAWTQLRDVILGKINVIETEIARKKDASVTPEQLEEFKEVFRHFDKDNSGHLNALELKACIASLGAEPTDDEMKIIMASLDHDGGGHVEFNEFVTFMVSRTSDQDSEDQVVQAFAAIVGDAAYITLEQMQGKMDPDDVAYLTANMPPYPGVENAYDYKAWTSSCFAAKQ